MSLENSHSLALPERAASGVENVHGPKAATAGNVWSEGTLSAAIFLGPDSLLPWLSWVSESVSLHVGKSTIL